MENKEYYIDLLQSRLINFNPYWEDPIKESKLVKNTKESVELLKTYFGLLKSLSSSVIKEMKIKKLEETYENYPNIVKETVKNIIDIISDGRDLWHEIEYNNIESQLLSPNPKPRKYDHHVSENGHLYFENNPFDELDCYVFLEDLEEILNSEKNTVNLNKYINGKWYLFQGYESGSASVRFSKINKTKSGKYTFDGDMIFWATIDSKYDGDGIIINTDLEDVSFTELPYCREELNDEESIKKFIESAEKIETDKQIRKEVHNIMDSFLENIID